MPLNPQNPVSQLIVGNKADFKYMPEYKRNPRHSQNFIRRPELVRDLLDISSINADDFVVEIGPGKGIITRELLKRAKKVVAVEQDEDLAKQLSNLAPQSNLQVIYGDFLSWSLPEGHYKIFSNIPFNFTADIVEKITTSPRAVDDAYLIMQEAAAHRFAGRPYSTDTLKSIMLGAVFEVNLIRKIGRAEFDPKPGVDIAFVRFCKRKEPLIPQTSLEDFYDFVVYGYTQWKPTTLEAFKKVFSYKQSKIIARDLNFTSLKVTDLSLEQWIVLFDTYISYVDTRKRSLIQGSQDRLKREQARIEKRHRTRSP